MSRILKQIAYGVLLICLGVATSQARWAKWNEASSEYQFYNKDIYIYSDGTDVETVESKKKILNEAGRERASTKKLVYNADNEDFEILEAKTISPDGGEHKVDISSIEKKPLASSPYGFDQKYQALIVFPNVSVNSSIYLKTKKTTHAAPIKGYYSAKLFFGAGMPWKKSNVTVTSELPLNYKTNGKTNGKDKHLTIKSESKKTPREEKYRYKVNLKQPVFYNTTNEPEFSMLTQDDFLWVQFSTEDSYKNIGRSLGRGYRRVSNQELPKKFEEIKSKAAREKNLDDKINIVTSQLNNKIRYMGDWRSINGKFLPRDLDTVADSGFGDCKDFATITASILKKLGFQARVALVNRDEVYVPAKTKKLPGLYFNHAIVHLKDENDGDKWIDPTNFVSMASYIFPDIANRPSLVLDADNPLYKQIPAVNPNNAMVEDYHEVEFGDNKNLHYKSDVKFLGQQAIVFTGAKLKNSEENIKEVILNILAGTKDAKETKVNLPDLSSTIVRDLKFEAVYTCDNKLIATNYGLGKSLTLPTGIEEVNNSQKGTIWLGYPKIFKSTTIFKNRRAKDIEKLNFSIDNSWIKSSRRCSQIDKDLKVVEYFEFKSSYIRPEEIASDSFKHMQDMSKDYGKVYLISSPY
jgi:hypothetical protein